MSSIQPDPYFEDPRSVSELLDSIEAKLDNIAAKLDALIEESRPINAVTWTAGEWDD